MDWDLDLGDTDTRTAIHKRHRGSWSRGISAPALGSNLHNIMLWWRPERGEAIGYQDGWASTDDVFFFSGTGQVGDQFFEAPLIENMRVRDHAADGNRIRLLRYLSSNQVQYIGELRLDPGNPWWWKDGLDRTLTMRLMIQFQFVPVGDVVRHPGDPVRESVTDTPHVERLPPLLPKPKATDVESLGAVRLRRLIRTQEIYAERVEAELVHDFHDWLHDRNVISSGLRIPYLPEGRDLRADLYIASLNILVEAKSTTAREKIRLAIGQLLDYRRFLTPAPRLCLLTPFQPPPDMIDLLDSLGIVSAWRSDRSFTVHPLSLLDALQQ